MSLYVQDSLVSIVSINGLYTQDQRNVTQRVVTKLPTHTEVHY